MNRLVRQIHNSFEYMKQKKWDKIYVAVDIHSTVMGPTYSDNLSHKFYDDSLETLKLMSNDKQICLILWTSSNKDNTLSYFNLLKNEGINMDYINCNPEVVGKHYADYSSKFYFNLILDDKAGWNLLKDWRILKK